MEARPCQIIEFFNGTKQMMVPLFQRPYEWEATHWETLWNDLLEQYEQPEVEVVSHFTGAIVTAPARSVPVGVSKYLVIDGQQRLTTVAVLLCAIRGLFERDSPKYRKLSRLLVNEDDEGLDHFKLLPTQPDRAAFQALVNEQPIEGTRFTQAYEFFRRRLQTTDSNGEQIDLERMATALQGRLTVVAIHLADSDDPYLIFESLNAKGAPLTQADLIRNYLLLRLHASAQQKAYEEAWLPMQALLGDHLTEFMRQYLMQGGEDVARSSIYSVLKKRLLSVPDQGVADELSRMRRASKLFARIIGLEAHPEAALHEGLARLRRWEVATANPFLLRLFDAHEGGKVSTADVAACLAAIESFAVRRTICRVPTNQLKRIFLSLAKEMPDGDVAAWMSRVLAGGASGRRWPKDDEFRESLATYRAYAQPLDRCKFILERFELSHGHKEPAAFGPATIEHVLPQTLSDEWKAELGADAMAIHERWLDVFGNLTLTGYNSELSNSPFETKRGLLAESHFEMNRAIAERTRWTEDEIKSRTAEIFESLRKIWPRPDPALAA